MAQEGKKAPTNTSRAERENSFGFLGELLTFGSASIPRQEKRAQGELVTSNVLPTDLRASGDYDVKTILEAAGVKFVSGTEDDPLFQFVELPAGWKKVPTDHAMWSKLVDDKGRPRASIFYKGASYDRRSHMHLETRFQVSRDFKRQEKEGVAVTRVTDGDNVIYTTDPIQLPKDPDKQYDAATGADELAKAWLQKNHPKWENPGAYWD